MPLCKRGEETKPREWRAVARGRALICDTMRRRTEEQDSRYPFVLRRFGTLCLKTSQTYRRQRWTALPFVRLNVGYCPGARSRSHTSDPTVGRDVGPDVGGSSQIDDREETNDDDVCRELSALGVLLVTIAERRDRCPMDLHREHGVLGAKANRMAPIHKAGAVVFVIFVSV